MDSRCSENHGGFYVGWWPIKGTMLVFARLSAYSFSVARTNLHDEPRLKPFTAIVQDALGAFCSHSPALITGHATGPLAGLCCGIKDLYHLAGLRTGFGHPVWLNSHEPALTTAVAVQRLLAAGASVVGKTQCDELCYSLNGINQHYGTPLNVRAPECIPGGSSSGSAAAVAGGLVEFSLGSDTGGSVRVPASYCGVLGMRPSFDAVPLQGAVPFAPSYDTAGWFATIPTDRPPSRAKPTKILPANPSAISKNCPWSTMARMTSCMS